MTMENNSLVLAAKSALPSLGSNVTYSQVANMFLSTGYTSAAGNMYQEGLRLSKYVAVNFSIGHGYCRSFLNGIRIFTWDGQRPKLVKEKTFSCYFWSESAAKEESIGMLKEYLKNSCKMLGLGQPSDSELRRLSESLIGETTETTQLIGSGV